MLKSIVDNKDIRTTGYVLRRTSYGEADRILSLITPHGKLNVIAKGVRKSKSKLAGSIELFTLTDYNIHFGKSELGVVTGAKMINHYGGILKDFRRMELAGVVLKKISQASENLDNNEYYDITKQVLVGLDKGWPADLIEAWFWLHLIKSMGEEINLYRDVDGVKLMPEKNYYFDGMQLAFSENTQGDYGVNEIKVLRLMATSELRLVNRVKIDDDILAKVLNVSRMVAHL